MYTEYHTVRYKILKASYSIYTLNNVWKITNYFYNRITVLIEIKLTSKFFFLHIRFDWPEVLAQPDRFNLILFHPFQYTSNVLTNLLKKIALFQINQRRKKSNSIIIFFCYIHTAHIFPPVTLHESLKGPGWCCDFTLWFLTLNFFFLQTIFEHAGITYTYITIRTYAHATIKNNQRKPSFLRSSS